MNRTRLGWISKTLVAAACTVGLVGTADAAGTKVTAKGMAAIVDGDKPRARDEAIKDAQRKAVEQAVGTMVSSETVTENYQLVSDKVYSKAAGYVRRYDIASENPNAGGVYEVTINAEVDSGGLESDLLAIMAVLQAKNMPRVLVMIGEQAVGSAQTAAWWDGDGSYSMDLGVAENVFIDRWGSKGVIFVDRQALSGKMSVGKAIGAAPADDKVKEFALGAGADVVVIGKAISNDVGTIMGTAMHSIRGNASLRALDVDTGRILATITQTSTVGHIDPTTGSSKALEKVATDAADGLLLKILDGWQKGVAGPSTVVVTIGGVKKFKLARMLKKKLGALRGVDGIRDRPYSKKTAQFDIEYKGSSQDLAILLEDASLGKYSLEVEEITANAVKATLVGR